MTDVKSFFPTAFNATTYGNYSQFNESPIPGVRNRPPMTKKANAVITVVFLEESQVDASEPGDTPGYSAFQQWQPHVEAWYAHRDLFRQCGGDLQIGVIWLNKFEDPPGWLNIYPQFGGPNIVSDANDIARIRKVVTPVSLGALKFEFQTVVDRIESNASVRLSDVTISVLVIWDSKHIFQDQVPVFDEFIEWVRNDYDGAEIDHIEHKHWTNEFWIGEPLNMIMAREGTFSFDPCRG